MIRAKTAAGAAVFLPFRFAAMAVQLCKGLTCLNIIARFVVRKKWFVITAALLLAVPAVIGYAATKINYNILEYLPAELDSVAGTRYLEDDFKLASTAMVTIDNLPTADILALKQNLQAINGVRQVLWVDDLVDVTVPEQALPSQIQDLFFSGNTTLMIVTFEENISSDLTNSAIIGMKSVLFKGCLLSGVSAIVNETRALVESELPLYVGVAVLLVLAVLLLGMESTLVPFIFLGSIGLAVLYNFGSNILLGEISYITKALSAVLQLGVTMDFSIFLLHRYDEERMKTDDHRDAMAAAIKNTAAAITGSSTTTIAGFLALCTMSLTIGRDMGIVMAKGVLIGLICSLTVLPALLLVFDKPVHRHIHKTFIPSLKKTSYFVEKRYKLITLIFLAVLIPFIYFQSQTKLYYDLTESLPEDLISVRGAKEIAEKFNRPSTNFLLVDDSLKSNEIADMAAEIAAIDGVSGVICKESLVGDGLPESILPKAVDALFHAGGKRLLVISSAYSIATDRANQQVDEIREAAKKVDENALFTGETSMTKDLIEAADVDFKNVSIASIAAVFVIILIVFGSVTLPVILVAAIESAIMINMGIPFLTGTSLPFITSIVLGTIQLGATIDYAILMTTRFREERRKGLDAQRAAQISVETCSKPILSSGLAFFGATIGVAMISKLDMLKSICLMISMGALISMTVIIVVLPALLIIFSKLIEKTSYRFALASPRDTEQGKDADKK